MDTIQHNAAVETPHELYSRLLQERQERVVWLTRRDRALGYAKLGIAVLAAFFLVQFVHLLHGVLPLLITVLVFAVLAIAHEIVLVRIRSTKAVLSFYERGLARLEDRWAGTGEGGERFISDTHPYSRDLDLFGKGSIFELLCIFRTRAGEEALARWLLNPAQPEEILIRQAAVRELKERIAFRERLFATGDKVRLGLRPDRLTAWTEHDLPFAVSAVVSMAIGLAALWVASLVYGITTGSYTGLILASAVNIAVNHAFRKRLASLVETTEDAADDLNLFAQVLRVLEQEQFSSVMLRNLQAVLQTDGLSSAVAVSRLDRITNYLKQHHNPLIRFFDSFLFYTVLVTTKTESWRKKFGPSIRGWLGAAGEMEALAALASYAFEHPDDAWPEFSSDAACFDAEALAHPLLPARKAVCNDLKLDDSLRLIILSGPNMSGKSTFIRGIGLNAVLAQCGAPVRAKRLKMSPLAIGASICVLDSLQGGVSRFYAEIRRLKAISDLTQGPVPVLFLLDELFSGTNSHDRLDGTNLVVKTLLQHGAIGMVTTHDLALTRIPESMTEGAKNYHFEDRVEGDKLLFDFKLHPGIVQTSNALKLLTSIGFSEGAPSA